jgi:L-methionine (R)-S-oxide reductase
VSNTVSAFISEMCMLTSRDARSGFYIHPPETQSSSSVTSQPLLLGPFCGRPACQIIQPIAGKGVCADAFVGAITLVVPDVHAYPGHIGACGDYLSLSVSNLELMITASPACDALSQSEIVVPVKNKAGAVVGVLDLDSTVKGTFDEVDKLGLERIAEALRI